MRQLTSLCFQCRHSVFARTNSYFGAGYVPLRYSSLSAIHRGLRDSAKARPQGFIAGDLKTNNPRRAKSPLRSTSPRRQDPNWIASSVTTKKGKKDITDKGPKRLSRSARFHNPAESFGKKSLVYQLKHGALKDHLTEVADQKGSVADLRPQGGREDRFNEGRGRSSDSRGFEDKFYAAIDDRFGRKRDSRSVERPSRGRGGSDRFGDRSGDRGQQDKFETRSSEGRGKFSRFEDRPSGRVGKVDRFEYRFEERGRQDELDARPLEGRGRVGRYEDHPSPSRRGGRTDRFEDRRDSRFEARSSGGRDFGLPASGHSGPAVFRGGRDVREGLEPRDMRGAPRSRDDYVTIAPSPQDAEKRESNSFRLSSPKDDMPIRIHHTTAASQFLYGRSVVAAALKNSGRQLYNIYIYSGNDRQKLSQDAHVENLARDRGLRITRLPDSNGLRMMDKMSGGRPHNGCVLEASPLPQLPLKGLGPMSEDTAKPGFSLILSHQSSEEAAINGTSDFVSYRARGQQKPFILVLDGILDPGNLGAVLRTAAFLGVTGVAITKHNSATLTPVALKASAGASEVLPLYSVSSTVDFLERSKESGWMTYAAVPSGPRSRGNSHVTLEKIESYDPLSSQPTILVIGSEGEGLTKPVKRIADFEVSIPSASGLFSVVDSLNVSVATGILCSAFLKKSHGFEIDESSDAKKEEDQLW